MLDDQCIRIPFMVRIRDFSFLQGQDQLWNPLAPLFKGYWGYFIQG